jgi:uncharacterized protein (TIGR00255 family)
MKSMTGFGHAEGNVDNFEVTVDIKTVNSRYFDFKPKLPRELSSLESEFRRLVQNKLKRGRIDFYVDLKPTSGGQLEINEAMVDSYLQVAEQLTDKGVGGSLHVYNMMNLPGVLVSTVHRITSGDAVERLLGIVDEAVRGADETRCSEGESLKDDLEKRLKTVAEVIPDIEARLGNIKEIFERKFTQKMKDLALALEVDQQRMAQELVYYIEKSDVTEELIRLKSHVQRFRDFLGRGAEQMIGKNLDFLCQEMNREANTVLAKSPLPEVTDSAVLIKGEIERIREQVQNVE